MPKVLYAEDVQVGTQLPTLKRFVDTQRLVKYAGAEEDWFQGHYDHLFATGIGFPGVYGHGWLTFAFLMNVVTDWMGPDGTVKRAHCRYGRPVLAGTELTLKGVVAKIEREDGEELAALELQAVDPEGQVFGSAEVLVSLPNRGKQ